MMSQGRGSAGRTEVVVAVVLLSLLVQSQHSHGATYTVGGSGGWTFNTANWPKGKRFKAGDVLVFNYDPTIHNVVAVDKGGYSGCTTPASAKVYNTGNDMVKLVKGQNFFICSSAQHCESGMKIAINAM